jgi:ABC-type transport system involved in multi-copper enzyme maturation permease subunit
VNFLPIVARELRVASRRRGTYWSRTVAAAVAIGIFALLSVEVARVSPRGFGPILFNTLASLFGIVAAVAGVRYTADALSEEKREGTMGLLFLTDLRGYDVVLGKLVATSLNAFYGLLAILPVLAVAFLLGGVSLAQFGRVTLVLLNTLLISLCIGLFVSSLARDARVAMSTTFLTLLLLFLGFPALSAFLGRAAPSVGSAALMLPSTGYTFWLSSDLGYGAQPARFWLSLAVSHAVAWCGLIGACLITPRSWMDRPAGGAGNAWRQRWHRLLGGGAAATRAFRTRLLDINPCLWLGARFRFRQGLLWVSLAFLGALWFAGWLKWRAEWLEIEVSIMTGFITHLFLKLTLASEASQRLGAERQHRTLELILATPLSVREILHGHFLALRHHFAGPILAVLGFDLVLFVLGLRATAHWSHSAWMGLVLVGVATLLIDLYALAWTGLWTGLTNRYANRAAGSTVARVLVLPWVLWILLIFALESGRRGSYPASGLFLYSWATVGILTSTGFLLWSRHQLHQHLRSLASHHPLTRPPSLWTRLSGASRFT